MMEFNDLINHQPAGAEKEQFRGLKKQEDCKEKQFERQ